MGLPEVVVGAIAFVAVFIICGFFGVMSFNPFPGRFYVTGAVGAGMLFGAVAVVINLGRK